MIQDKLIKILLVSCLLMVVFSVNAEKKLPLITLAGPFAAVSDPLMRMVETGALSDVADELKFEVWRNPDQMRALALNGYCYPYQRGSQSLQSRCGYTPD